MTEFKLQQVIRELQEIKLLIEKLVEKPSTYLRVIQKDQVCVYCGLSYPSCKGHII